MPFNPTPDEDRKVQTARTPMQAQTSEVLPSLQTTGGGARMPTVEGPAAAENPYSSLLKPHGDVIDHGSTAGKTAANIHPDPNAGMPTGYSAAPMAGGNSGPTATGFVNFDRLYNANAGAAQRGAIQQGNAAEQKARQAKTDLGGLQSKFNAAEVAPNMPTQQEQDWAKFGGTGVDEGKRTTAAYDPIQGLSPTSGADSPGVFDVLDTKLRGGEVAPTGKGRERGFAETDDQYTARMKAMDAATKGGTQGYNTEEQEGLSSGGVNRLSSADDLAAAQRAGYGTTTDPATEAAVRAAAGKQFTNPYDALSSMDEYSKLAQDTEAAQQGVNTLPNEGKSGNSIDQDLMGASGRPAFHDMQNRYGNIKGALDKANTDSSWDAKATQGRADASHNAYSSLLKDFDSRRAADQGRAQGNEDASNATLNEAQQLHDANAQNVGNTTYDTRTMLHNLANDLSPVDSILKSTGNQSIADRAAGYASDNGIIDAPNDQKSHDAAPPPKKKKRESF